MAEALLETPATVTISKHITTRLVLVGTVVFLANASLLVLQLVAGRLLAPFIGSSLETWTGIIAAFLTGIAVGNAVGGRMAQKSPTLRKLWLFLVMGAVAAIWMTVLPWVLNTTEIQRNFGLKIRIPILAFAMCLPVGFILSLLTPLAIRIGVPDVGRTGRVAGLVFSLSTLGCVLGNYVTGFVLIPSLTINEIVYTSAGLLVATSLMVMSFTKFVPTPATISANRVIDVNDTPPPKSFSGEISKTFAIVIVFCCSFAGMTLELAATRLLAVPLGVSLFTWTGVIGVMLTGTAFGNWFGGRVADRYFRERSKHTSELILGSTMIAAGVFGVLVILLFTVISSADAFREMNLIVQVLAWTFALFFLPMMLLGMVSPQVIRLCVGNIDQAGKVAGEIYAWSTAGAIVGTLATGFVLISNLGVLGTILLAGVLPCLATALVVQIWRQPVMLYVAACVMGAFFGGSILLFRMNNAVVLETNYYTIRVSSEMTDMPPAVALAAVVGPISDPQIHEVRTLLLDHLIHSKVDMSNPTYLFYKHEQIQMETLHNIASRKLDQNNVLVVGGGGYTFPRCAKTLLPQSQIDVVEIDPGVTAVAFDHLGLSRDLNLGIFHMDGRQFIAEQAKKDHYDLITLDAVNDFSVPYHLLTQEFNQLVKKTLKPDGVYLVTVIDMVADGKLWKATYHTLKKDFAHVELIFPMGYFKNDDPESVEQCVQVLYASDRPWNAAEHQEFWEKQAGKPSQIEVVPQPIVQWMLERDRPLILTDQYAPVDNLLAQVFRMRLEAVEEEDEANSTVQK